MHQSVFYLLDIFRDMISIQLRPLQGALMEIWTLDRDNEKWKIEPFIPFPCPDDKPLSMAILDLRRLRPSENFIVTFSSDEAHHISKMLRVFVHHAGDPKICDVLDKTVCLEIRINESNPFNNTYPIARYVRPDLNKKLGLDNNRLAIIFSPLNESTM
jgi:hypothetical protein